MLNSITNMGKKTKKKAAPPPPPLNSGQRVRFGSAEGYVSKINGDTYDVALDGGKVIQAARDKLEPIVSKRTMNIDFQRNGKHTI